MLHSLPLDVQWSKRLAERRFFVILSGHFSLATIEYRCVYSFLFVSQEWISKERILDGWVRVSRFAIDLDVWVRVSLELDGSINTIRLLSRHFLIDPRTTIQQSSPAFFLHTTEWLTIEQDFHSHTIIFHHSKGTYVCHRQRSAGTTRFFVPERETRMTSLTNCNDQDVWISKATTTSSPHVNLPMHINSRRRRRQKNHWRQVARKTKKRPKAFLLSFDISTSFTIKITQ